MNSTHSFFHNIHFSYLFEDFVCTWILNNFCTKIDLSFNSPFQELFKSTIIFFLSKKQVPTQHRSFLNLKNLLVEIGWNESAGLCLKSKGSSCICPPLSQKMWWTREKSIFSEYFSVLCLFCSSAFLPQKSWLRNLCFFLFFKIFTTVFHHYGPSKSSWVKPVVVSFRCYFISLRRVLLCRISTLRLGGSVVQWL